MLYLPWTIQLMVQTCSNNYIPVWSYQLQTISTKLPSNCNRCQETYSLAGSSQLAGRLIDRCLMVQKSQGQPPGMKKKTVNNGNKLPTSTGERRISEPSTVGCLRQVRSQVWTPRFGSSKLEDAKPKLPHGKCNPRRYGRLLWPSCGRVPKKKHENSQSHGPPSRLHPSTAWCPGTQW